MMTLHRIRDQDVNNLILQSDTQCTKIRSTEHAAENTESQSVWVNAPVSNLVRYKSSGICFARLRIRGKLFRNSLKTDVISAAKLRLGDFIKDRRAEMGDDSAVHSGRMTAGDAIGIFRQRLDGQHDITRFPHISEKGQNRRLLTLADASM